MTTPQERLLALRDILASRVLILDGAMGSMLHQTAAIEDYGGPEYENCCENILRIRPEIILDIHRRYLASGADMIETDSFGGHPVTLADFKLRDRVHELNFKAAQIARQAAEEFSTPAKPRFVAGSMGPTTKSISLQGGVTFEELIEGYYEQAR
jgi:5-methyltetrahydrofolate--homocysteine methyltransferase